MNPVVKSIRKLVRKSGFDVVRYREIGSDPFADMRHFLRERNAPLVLDVGANVGQSVDRFKKAFPACLMHSFEPSPTTFEQLKVRCGGIPGVQTWNCGVGSQSGTLAFLENDHSDMSSFLPPSDFAWGQIVRTTDVQVITLDSFAREQNIGFIDVLKSDTQGYDFEVFKGANQLMRENKIGLIYFEYIFSDMYKDLPPFHEVFRYLLENNFSLVTFYGSNFQQDLVSWTDALFINRDFNRKRNQW